MATLLGLDLEALWKGGYFGAFVGKCLKSSAQCTHSAMIPPKEGV